MKVKVCIEEHLCKEIEIECPDDMENDDRLNYAEEKVKEMYDNEEIVLTSDDYNGITLINAEDIETGASTEWHEI